MQPELPDRPTEIDIDRKALRALRDRFAHHNAARLAALRARLILDHRTFVDALPVLLHSNHAALPGFVDFEMPCGIDKYTPDRNAIAAVRRFALSFTQERFVERRAHILGLYVAWIPAANGFAALELTVCCASAMHSQLQLKLADITRFAADRGLHLSTRLLDSNATPAPGASQTPALDRDAFYRSAILLAGRYPLWWLVPPDQDDEYAAYCARVKTQRFIARDESLDLGGASRIPRDECLVAGVLHLDAALDAPYSHLLELMLLEHFANDPAALPLARLYKARIWRNEPDIETALLAYESIATYLTKRGEHDAQELARHCLIASMRSDPRISELSAQWRWHDTQVRHARNDHEPTIAELQLENARVTAELQRAHLHLTGLVATPLLRARLEEIGGRIARLVEQPHGTIPCLNPALLPKRIAGHLRVASDHGGWRLHDDSGTIFVAPRLATLMAWAHLHHLRIDNLHIDDADRRKSCARMLDLFAQHTTDLSEATQLLIVNAEETPFGAHTSHGEALVSGRDDPLDFSGFHTSLVAGIDVIDIRAVGMTPNAYIGDDGLIEVLLRLLCEPSTRSAIVCVAGERQRAVEERLVSLAADIAKSFAGVDQASRFAFALADGFVIIERVRGEFRARRCANEEQLYSALATPLSGGTLNVDTNSDRLDGLSQLCKLGTSDHDTLLIHARRTRVRVLLMSHDGGVAIFEPPPRPALDLAEQLVSLFSHLGQRRTKAVRAPTVYIATGRGAPTRVMPSTIGQRAHQASHVEVVARNLMHRGLVAMLSELFAIERTLAERTTHA